MISYKKIKPIFDWILAFILLFLLSPIFIIISIFIMIDSKGPVFFIQERLGIHETSFNLIKFRTMTNKQRDVHRQVFEKDPEVTRFGSILRRFKLDELPQLFNVLKGEMSIVGPRPCLHSLRSKFDHNTSFRFLVKPGLTSLAALKGSIYLSWPQKWYYDRVYVEKLSFLFDMKIILSTFKIILIGEKRIFKKK